MEKIKIPTPEERRIKELERENKMLNEKVGMQDMLLEDLLFNILPKIEGGQS